MMPLGWLLQLLLLFYCCGSNGSGVRASIDMLTIPPKPVVLQAHYLQRCDLQDYTWLLAQLPISCCTVSLKPTIYTEKMHRNLIFGTRLHVEAINNRMVGSPEKFQNTSFSPKSSP